MGVPVLPVFHGPPSVEKKMMEKLKPRTFRAEPKVLSMLGAQNYDRFPPEQLELVQFNVEKQLIDKLKDMWKTMDEDKLIHLIRKQIVREMTRLEERKHVHETRAKEIEKKKRKAQEAKERAELEKSTAGSAEGFKLGAKDAMSKGTSRKFDEFTENRSMMTFSKSDAKSYATGISSIQALAMQGAGGEF